MKKSIKISSGTNDCTKIFLGSRRVAVFSNRYTKKYAMIQHPKQTIHIHRVKPKFFSLVDYISYKPNSPKNTTRSCLTSFQTLAKSYLCTYSHSVCLHSSIPLLTLTETY